MFKWQAINPCNSIQIEFNQMMGLVLMKPHNFIALLIWITLSLQTLPSFSEHTAERETALCISANGRKGGGIQSSFFLHIQNVEVFPYFVLVVWISCLRYYLHLHEAGWGINCSGLEVMQTTKIFDLLLQWPAEYWSHVNVLKMAFQYFAK